MTQKAPDQDKVILSKINAAGLAMGAAGFASISGIAETAARFISSDYYDPKLFLINAAGLAAVTVFGAYECLTVRSVFPKPDDIENSGLPENKRNEILDLTNALRSSFTNYIEGSAGAGIFVGIATVAAIAAKHLITLPYPGDMQGMMLASGAVITGAYSLMRMSRASYEGHRARRKVRDLRVTGYPVGNNHG